MAGAREQLGSLRFSRFERERLVLALLLSLAVHLAIWGGYAAGQKVGLWPARSQPKKLNPKGQPPPPPALAENSEPIVFIDVNHAEPEPPKQAKFYSNKNSLAANPDVADVNQPKLNGQQTMVPKTEDAPRLSTAPPTPPPPQPEPAATTAQPVEPAKAAQPVKAPGNLAPSPPKPERVAEKSAVQPAPARPRTVKQALAQREQLPGQKLKQDGGVRRQRVWSSLDAKATPFGDYDRAIVEAVTQRWYDLLDSQRFAQDRTGKVVLRFKLKFDGTIIEMQTLENTVGDLLGYVCQESVQEAAPFGKWPDDMRRMIGANFREITFTFYYY